MACVWQSGVSPNPSAIANAMDALQELGLLRAVSDEMASTTCPEPAPLETVAIVTVDRPRALHRTLSALQPMEASARRHVLVVDGSQTNAEATRALVHETRWAGADATYAGATAALTLRRMLASEGIPPPLLDEALTPGSIGNNRNLALLMTAGHPVLMQDDDVVSRLWVDPDRESGVTLAAHSDLRTWQFFASRDAALASVASVNDDALDAHASALGRSLAQILQRHRDSVDVEHACSHMVAALDDADHFAVRVTFAGLAGDAARYCSHGVLFRQGLVRDVIWRDPESLERALSSREISCIARNTIVTHETMCVGYCMGIDNTSLVPPFMPVGRNEDGVWGATLGAIDPHALFAHVPYGVRHESDRPATYEDLMPSARQSRICDLLLFLITRHGRATFAISPADRLRHLGQVLVDVGRLPAADFRILSTEARLSTLCNDIAQAESVMASDPMCPPHWRRAVDDYEQTFRRHVVAPDFFLPIEFKNSASLEEGFANAQAYVGRFGELLMWWPQIWEIARQANAQRRDAVA
jgi:hypothetical protein